MNPVPSNAAAVTSFHVKYQSGSRYNRDLAGTGTVSLGPDRFVFRGRARGVFFRGPETEVVLRADQIRNVVRRGKAVSFSTPVGRSAEKKQPFVVFCADPSAAVALAAALPAERDEAFVAAADFHTRLRQVTPDVGGVTSVTNWIVAVNVLVFVIMGLLGAGWLEPASMRPYMLYVANNAAATTDGQWWRLLTAMFVHYGLLHLALNMWALFQAGHLVERLFGRKLYALVYFGAGLISSTGSLLWHGDKLWSAGASGAIFGVYGALLGYFWRQKHGIPRSVFQPIMKSTLVFTAYNLFYGAVHPQIDNVAHLGGLAGGIVLGWLCALPLEREVRAAATPRRLAVGAAVVIAVVGIGAAAAPRYHYHVREELAWADAVREPVKAEPQVLAPAASLFGGPDAEKNTMAIAAWLRDGVLPFYVHWRAAIVALPLTPGYATAERRDALVKVLNLKIASYRELLIGIETHDRGAFERYFAQQQAIVTAIDAMRRTAAP